MTAERVPIREGLLSESLEDLDAVTLLGGRCARCGETALGSSALCQNCGAEGLESIPLGREGTLWTYTVVRHKPPGDYRGPDPFVPFGLGLVELPEGIRVLSPLGGDIASLRIGQSVSFKPVILSGDVETVAFQFIPINP
jgi:uncharacterized OB-fold protein